MKFILITGLSAFALGVSMTAQAQVTTVNRAISEPEVQAAQQAWCKALVDISAATPAVVRPRPRPWPSR